MHWQLHRKPELHATNGHGRNVTVDLSPLDSVKLHELFTLHFARVNVEPPSFFVRTWRRLFGWGYGMSMFDSVMFFVGAGIVLLVMSYVICYRYTATCDAIQDL